jgi:hypothetical protein
MARVAAATTAESTVFAASATAIAWRETWIADSAMAIRKHAAAAAAAVAAFYAAGFVARAIIGADGIRNAAVA